MPDNSIECVLGRLEEAVDNIKSDIDELKADHKEIKKFVDEQKNLYKYVWAAGSLLLGLLYFAKDIYDFVMKVKGHQ